MRTGLTKKQKTTMIYFDEHSRMIEMQTHNTDLKKRLTAFAAKHPQCCRQTDDDEQGGLTFEIEKGLAGSIPKAGSNSTPQTNPKQFPKLSIFFQKKVSIRWKNWMQPYPLSMTRQAKSAAA